MTRATRWIKLGGAVLFTLSATGCTSDADEPGTEPTDDSTSSSHTKATTAFSPASPRASTIGVSDDPTTYPLPPGATGWAVRDLASCGELGEITDRELVVRVPKATAECETYEADFMVIASKELPYDSTGGRAIDIDGFKGTVTAVGIHQSLGQRVLVEPRKSHVSYLVLSKGGTSRTIEDETTRLFSPK